jgi:hypothetical protein
MQKSQNQKNGFSSFVPMPAKLALLGLTGLVTISLSSAMADSLQLAQTQLAQTTAPALNVSELRECLCMEQQMASDHADLDTRQDLLNERQQDLANIDHQVDDQRAKLSPTDTVGQQVLKDLMAQQQTLRTLLQNDLRPAYNTRVNELNAVVSKYNAQCVGRERYATDVEAAQRNLQCPKP